MTLPPRIAEKVVGFLIPPASREEVLGDLHERCTSARQYLLDALLVIPMVIASRIRRTADPEVLLMTCVVAYLSYAGAAWFHDRDHLDFLNLAIPPLMILVGIILEDAYAKPGERSPLRLARGPILGLTIAYLAQLKLAAGGLPKGLPIRVWVYGSAITMLLASVLRALFPPVMDRPVRANGPRDSTPVARQAMEIVGLVGVAGLIGFFIGAAWLTRLVVISVVLMIYYKSQRD